MAAEELGRGDAYIARLSGSSSAVAMLAMMEPRSRVPPASTGGIEKFGAMWYFGTGWLAMVVASMVCGNRLFRSATQFGPCLLSQDILVE